jgi:hypothetical protein
MLQQRTKATEKPVARPLVNLERSGLKLGAPKFLAKKPELAPVVNISLRRSFAKEGGKYNLTFGSQDRPATAAIR